MLLFYLVYHPFASNLTINRLSRRLPSGLLHAVWMVFQMLVYDKTKPGYVSPESLLESIVQRYPRPLDVATACYFVMESIKASLERERSQFLHDAAEALNIDWDEVKKVGLAEARRSWVENAIKEVLDETDPGTTVASMMSIFGGRTDEDPTPDLIEELERRKHEIPKRLRAVERFWTFQEITKAVERLVANTGCSADIIGNIHEQRLALQQQELFRGFFATRTGKARSIQAILESASEVLDTAHQPTARTPASKRRKNLIPLNCSQSEFLKIAESLCRVELLYLNEVADPQSGFFTHFSFQGRSEPDSFNEYMPTITWRGTIGDLLGLFDWLELNLLMSVWAAKRSASMISIHFNRDGEVLSRNSVNSTKLIQGQTFGKSEHWRKNIASLMSDIYLSQHNRA